MLKKNNETNYTEVDNKHPKRKVVRKQNIEENPTKKQNANK